MDKFSDLEHILMDDTSDDQSSQVKLWSVFRMHYPDMRKALDKALGSLIESDLPAGDSQLEALARLFEDRVNEAKEIVLSWG